MLIISKIKSNNKECFKQLVRQENAIDNISFTLEFLKTQKLCKDNFSDISFLYFNKEHSLTKLILNSSFLQQYQNISFKQFPKNKNFIETTEKPGSFFIITDSRFRRLSLKQRGLLKKLPSSIIIFLCIIPQAKFLEKTDHFFSHVENGKLTGL